MDARERAIEAGARALVAARTGGLCEYGKVCDLCDCFAVEDGGASRDGYAEQHVAAVLDAVAPIIRADTIDALEEQVHIPVVWVNREHLRAQVEALPERGIGDVIRKADVLALLDGAQ